MELTISNIESKIYTIRSVQVMLDSHLAEMYGVDSKRLNEQVKRNIDRFPDTFRFQLTELEWKNLRSQFVTSRGDSLRSQIATLEKNENRGKHRKYLPYVFTEQGVAMLSAVLKSETAVIVSIQIMNAFVELRKMVLGNAGLFQRLDKVEIKQLEADHKFEQIFKALEAGQPQPKQGIFFDGQIFDAYAFVCDLIKKATKEIVLIDNYVDESVLTLMTKRRKNVSLVIYTKSISKNLQLDAEKHQAQYPPVEIKLFTNSHDRFLIIDGKEIYHIGASLKDLGKKWFAFSRMDSMAGQILINLKKGKI